MNGIPEIRDSQRAGIRLTSEVRVQTFSDYSLRVQFEKSRYLTVNGEVNLSEKGRINKDQEGHQQESIVEAELPSDLKNFLETPFVVHLKRGLVESFFVQENEPQSITNIKKAFLAQIQLDITGSRRDEISSNNVQQQQQQQRQQQQFNEAEQNDEISYFTTREETLLGDCQTSYTIHKVPEYRSLELEQEWKREEERLYQQHQLRSTGEESCEGKQYYKISKTKNLDNCLRRPFYQRFVGVEARCDGSKSACTDQFTVSIGQYFLNRVLS